MLNDWVFYLTYHFRYHYLNTRYVSAFTNYIVPGFMGAFASDILQIEATTWQFWIVFLGFIAAYSFAKSAIVDENNLSLFRISTMLLLISIAAFFMG